MEAPSIARGITDTFNNLVHHMSNSTYNKFPICALSLPQLKKVALVDSFASSTKPPPAPLHSNPTPKAAPKPNNNQRNNKPPPKTAQMNRKEVQFEEEKL
jgi:hypothetical protein